MEVKKDIGKAFREKLDSLDRQPSDALWNSISTELDNRKKKKFPFFWLYIATCTLIGIGVVAFIISNVTASSNASNPDNPTNKTEQAQTSDSPAATPAGNHSGNENTTTEASSANSPVISKNKSNDAIISTNATTNKATKNNAAANKAIKNNVSNSNATNSNPSNSNTSSRNILKNNTIKSNATRNSSKKQAITEKAVSQKSSVQENTDTAGKTRKQKAQYSGRNTVANGEIINTGIGTSKNNRSIVSNTAKDTNASTISDSKENSQKNQSGNSAVSNNTNNQKTTGQKQDDPFEKQTGSASQNKDTAITTAQRSEIATREKIPVSDRDSLPESSLTPKDSLTTETPKEEVATEEKKENKKDSIKPSIAKRLSVFAFAGPTLFSFPNSTIKTDSTTASVSTANPLRYGVLLGYRINEKFSVRAGVSFYRIKQSAKNLKLNYTIGGSAINPVLIPPADFDWIDYNAGVTNASVIDALGSSNRAIINIDSEQSYIEIPIEANYSIYNRKFGINLIAGGSMLLLGKNEVTASNQNGQMQLGKWNAATKTSFTGALGLGLHYKITPYLQLNAEPVFNYYFNTYNDSKPYSFTFRLGLQYNFDF
jgi:hypothetical protein